MDHKRAPSAALYFVSFSAENGVGSFDALWLATQGTAAERLLTHQYFREEKEIM